MKKLLFLLSLLFTTCAYAGNCGVSPLSNSPHEKKTESKVGKAKHKQTKSHSLKFKAHKKQSSNEAPDNTYRKRHRFKDWYDDLAPFWRNLPLMLLILGLASMAVVGLLLPITWLSILGASLYFAIIIITFILSDSLVPDLADMMYFLSIVIISLLGGLMAIGLGLGIAGLWITMAVLLGLYLAFCALYVYIINNFSLE